MPFGLGDGVMTFGGDDRDFQRVADNVERRMKQVADTFSSFAFSHPQFQTVIKGLDDVDKGAARAAESLLKIGRVSIFTRAADGLRSMAQEAEKFTVEIAKGTANINDLIEAMAKKIPFGIGALVEVGRDIHGLATGDTVSIAQSEADAKAAEKKIDFQTRLESAVRKVARAGEDANQKLNFTVGDSGFLNSIETILKLGQRAAENQRTELNSNQQLLDEGTARRKELLKQLEDIKAKPTIVHSTDPGEPTVFIPRSGEINDAERAIAKLDASLQSYRDRIGQLNAVLTEKGGRPTFTSIFELVGREGVKAFDAAGAAVKRYLGNFPQITSETSRAITEMGGKFLQLQTQLSAFQLDFTKGLISQKTLDQLNFNALNKTFGADFWKAAGAAVSNGFSQFQAAVDPKIGNTISNLREQLNNVLRTFGIGPAFTNSKDPKATPAFRSSLVGLTNLGSNIQAGAVGGDPVERILKAIDINIAKQKDIAQKQLDELKKNKPATVK